MKDPSLMDRAEKEIAAEAWDRGWDTAARCYWHKPRNPFSGQMNDDATLYCPEHGGTGTPDVCEDDSHPIPEPVRCTCQNHKTFHWMPVPAYHDEGCPMRLIITLPEVKAIRGGIKFGGTDGTQ